MKRLDRTTAVRGGYSRGARAGFTLIEILIVMVIVLIMAGLLLGAAVLVRGRVTGAQQMAEMSQIDLALSKFKQQYGFLPPSRIRLREWDVYSGAEPATEPYYLRDPLDAHSVSYLRRVWPSIKLYIYSGLNSSDRGQLVEVPTKSERVRWYQDDTNSTAWTPQVYDLEGDQCLVFFLGGVAQRIGQAQFILHGFTDDPTNPSRVPDASAPKTVTRTTKLFDFDAGRLFVRADFGTDLVDQNARPAESETTSSPTSRTEFYEYNSTTHVTRLGRLPSLKSIGADAGRPLPVAYFCSYDGRGYRPDDVNIPPAATVANPLTDTTIPFQLLWPGVTGPNPTVTGQTAPVSPLSLGPNPYTRTRANPAVATQIIQAYNPQGYQLILPGADGEYGGGGSQGDYAAGASTTAWSYNEDNMTNFSAGRPIGEFLQGQQGGTQ